MNKKKIVKDRCFVSADGHIKLTRTIVEGAAKMFPGKEIILTIEDAENIRTLDQNKYYFAAIVNPITEAFNDAGERFEPDEVHEILKYKFLRVVDIDEWTGEIKTEYVRSTAKLKIYEFCFYLEDCIRFAAEYLQLAIKPPAEHRQEYQFAVFQLPRESREAYIKRIASYLQDISTIDYLVRFFRTNAEWASDPELKALFTKRRAQIQI